jgi:putative tryptophan/tyrosine transport system substrate-binding protein
VAAWPVAAHAQQSERMRQVGVLMGAVANSPDGQSRIAAFQQGLQQLGWTEGRNVRIDTRWPAAGNADDIRRYAEELVALSPDVILATGSISIAPLLQTTRSVPIVFVQVVDPVGSGFVASLAQPGGNATGFTNFEYGLSAKWLELLKQIAPGVTRAAVLRDPTAAAGIGQFGAIQTAAPSLGVEVEQRGRGLEVFLKPGGPLDVCVSSSDGTRTAPRAGRGRATRRARASQRSVAATARSEEGVSGLLPCLLDYV